MRYPVVIYLVSRFSFVIKKLKVINIEYGINNLEKCMLMYILIFIMR